MFAESLRVSGRGFRPASPQLGVAKLEDGIGLARARGQRSSAITPTRNCLSAIVVLMWVRHARSAGLPVGLSMIFSRALVGIKQGVGRHVASAASNVEDLPFLL